jgi:3-deoxy-7-phosphoheptulonate synthase/chorismate mutase
MAEPIDELRARIADRDRALLAALNERLELVAALRREKDRLGLPFLDPEQERRVAEALVAANGGPCSEDGVRELVESVLALTKRELERGR